MIKAVVVGIDKMGQEDVYRLLVCNYAANPSSSVESYSWNFKCVMTNAEDLVKYIRKYGNDFILNIGFENNKITGKSAALTRFNSNKNHHPFLIISQIQNKANNNIIGYKIATYDGKVKNISLKEMIAYGNRATKQGLIPVQNAIFVPQENDKKAHFKSYPNMQFIVETYDSGKNKYTDNRRVQTKSNEKALVKASEIFTKEQMYQLGLGKKNGVDIRIYANPKLSAEQMEVLREGLQDKVNVKPFAFPEYTRDCMLSYICDLKNGLDIKKYLSPKYCLGQLFQLSLANEQGLNISKISNPSLTAEEMTEIRERLEANIWRDELVTKDGSWTVKK